MNRERIVSCPSVFNVVVSAGLHKEGLDSSFADEGSCNIDVRDAATITHTEFLQEYAYTKPVILRGITDNTEFRFLCSKPSLLKEYQDKIVRLSTANTHSYRKALVTVPS
ncbi:jmjC domain-containing protein 8 [Clarias magur]|uniref:JmjC domain-containing protein 8 n=1 Tax=Clarias magur TaxID=1594786 RepID=A0A8J4WSS5_CLAMG|nr:jmjC domain-containing protein 8 [Clarias magur]